MKNLTYLPFKKNRYFMGKLLTADDFEQEQKYLDDKRRLINRWVLGTGIAAGLEVIRVDDYSVSVEIGLALDHTGREIVVDMPAIIKLSMVDGYEEAVRTEGAESLYLCIEYDQIPAEPVHNITNRNRYTVEEEEYGKYREGYRLYVTDDEPVWERQEEGRSGSLARTVYDRAEAIHKDTYRRGIYLARIELIKAGEFYMIEQVLPPPEVALICPLPVATDLLMELCQKVDALGREPNLGKPPETASVGAVSAEENVSNWQFEQGQVSIRIPNGKRVGDCLYSEEVAHGLGLGDVELILHVKQGAFNYSGAEGIFPDEERMAEASARLDIHMGTFVVGIRLLEIPEEETIEVGWTAIRKRSRNEIQLGEPRIFIQPGVVNGKTREDIQLQAVCVNMEASDLLWRVADPGGGSIEPDGTYHAPNRQGVYEVICEKRNHPQIRASVFIIVRE